MTPTFPRKKKHADLIIIQVIVIYNLSKNFYIGAMACLKLFMQSLHSPGNSSGKAQIHKLHEFWFFYQWAQFFSTVYLQFIIYHCTHLLISCLDIKKKLGWHFCKPFILLNSSTIDHYSGILIPMQSDNADTWSFTNVINYISLPTCVSEGESSGTFNDTNVTQKFSPKIFVILKKF